jgi:hypothetical protein
MANRLREFAEHVKNASKNARSEKIVRCMVEETAKNCPIHILVQIGQFIVDCRKSELREEAERN